MKTPDWQRAGAPWPLVLRNRIPTVEEALEAVVAPLHESYWWFSGLDFNRPVMCSVNVACHIKNGPSVRVYFANETPVGGFTSGHFEGRSFRMWGPVKLPAELLSAEHRG